MSTSKMNTSTATDTAIDKVMTDMAADFVIVADQTLGGTVEAKSAAARLGLIQYMTDTDPVAKAKLSDKLAAMGLDCKKGVIVRAAMSKMGITSSVDDYVAKFAGIKSVKDAASDHARLVAKSQWLARCSVQLSLIIGKTKDQEEGKLEANFDAVLEFVIANGGVKGVIDFYGLAAEKKAKRVAEAKAVKEADEAKKAKKAAKKAKKAAKGEIITIEQVAEMSGRKPRKTRRTFSDIEARIIRRGHAHDTDTVMVTDAIKPNIEIPGDGIKLALIDCKNGDVQIVEVLDEAAITDIFEWTVTDDESVETTYDDIFDVAETSDDAKDDDKDVA